MEVNECYTDTASTIPVATNQSYGVTLVNFTARNPLGFSQDNGLEHHHEDYEDVDEYDYIK